MVSTYLKAPGTASLPRDHAVIVTPRDRLMQPKHADTRHLKSRPIERVRHVIVASKVELKEFLNCAGETDV